MVPRGRQFTEAAASGTLPPHSKQALAPRFKREKMSHIKYKRTRACLTPALNPQGVSWSQAEEILTLDTRRHSGGCRDGRWNTASLQWFGVAGDSSRGVFPCSTVNRNDDPHREDKVHARTSQRSCLPLPQASWARKPALSASSGSITC